MTRGYRITERGLVGKFFAAVGLLIVVGEIALHFIAWATGVRYEMDEVVILTGALVGFAGFWMLDSKGTKDAAETIGALVPRFGRRKSDAVAVPNVRTEVIAEPVAGKAEGDPPSDKAAVG
jgi:hypothetical protein